MRSVDQARISIFEELRAQATSSKFQTPSSKADVRTLRRHLFSLFSLAHAAHLEPLPAHGLVRCRCLALPCAVAAAILAAVEDGILPSGMAPLNKELTATPARQSAGQDALLYSRRGARGYTKQIRVRRTSRSACGCTRALKSSQTEGLPCHCGCCYAQPRSVSSRLWVVPINSVAGVTEEESTWALPDVRMNLRCAPAHGAPERLVVAISAPSGSVSRR
jgi:hypothetical protein